MSMNFDQMVDGQEQAAPAKRGLNLELRRRPEFVVGGLPTVSLLPRELKAAARDKTIRRALVAGVIVAVIVAGGATAGATALSVAAQSRLTAANVETQSLLGQLGRFKDVQSLQQQIALGKSAVKVGASSEIDWQGQIDAIEKDMPSSYSVTSIIADSASPIVDYPQGSTPLEKPRVASLQVTVAAPTITELPIWLRKLRSLDAYADLTSTVGAGETSGYSVLLTIHLSPKALINMKAAAQ